MTLDMLLAVTPREVRQDQAQSHYTRIQDTRLAAFHQSRTGIRNDAPNSYNW
jgi:hypothetical protein